MEKVFVTTMLGICLCAAGCLETRHQGDVKETVITEAGKKDFTFVEAPSFTAVTQQIKNLDSDEHTIELDNGSVWSIANGNSVKGWDRSKKLVITQNHIGFSTAKYALVNLDLDLAEPINLIREPAPNKEALFIKEVDSVNNMVVLSDNRKVVIPYADRSGFNKILQNDRLILGVNSDKDKEKSPYILIDTTQNHFVRATIVN